MSKTYKILFITPNRMMADQVGLVYEALRADPRLTFWRTLRAYDQVELDPADSWLSRVPFLPSSEARQATWDMVITPEHTVDYDGSTARKVRVGHGLLAGKLVNGAPYRYGPLALRDDGSPRYDVMLEGTECCRDTAVRRSPALAPCIRVVGDLSIDAVLALKRDREVIRRALGVTASRPFVLVQSTFGPNGLMETVGDALIEKAHEIQDRYQFIITMHPNLLRDRFGHDLPRARWLRSLAARGFLVVEPPFVIDSYLVAADLLITDHTSQSLPYALLMKPLMFLEGCHEHTAEESLIRKLYPLCAHLHPTEPLEAAIERGLREFSEASLRELSPVICAHQGKAAEHVRWVLYESLGLGMPPGLR